MQKEETSVDSTVTVKDLCDAEMLIVKSVQQKAFREEIKILRDVKDPKNENRTVEKERQSQIKRARKIHKLDPFTDSDGLLKVGRRIKADSIDERVKHPILLPKKGHISQLIIRHCHERTNHQGRDVTMNELRSSGY